MVRMVARVYPSLGTEHVTNTSTDRRAILQTLGATGALSALALGAAPPKSLAQEVLAAEPESQPKHSIRFGVCGMSHDHIHGMIKAIQRGGGELVAAWGAEPDKLAGFVKRYPN